MTKRVTAGAVSAGGRARRPLKYGAKTYKAGQFVPTGARKKAFKLRSVAATKGWSTRRLRLDKLRYKQKLYRSTRVLLVAPRQSSAKTPTPLFEIGVFVYSGIEGQHSPTSLSMSSETRRALKLVLKHELNWNEASFDLKMVSETDAMHEHWEDNVRVDADEANVPLDEMQRYMLWYEPGGGTFKGMSVDRTDFDEAWFKRLEKRK